MYISCIFHMHLPREGATNRGRSLYYDCLLLHCVCLALARLGQPCAYVGSGYTNLPVTQSHLKMKINRTPFLQIPLSICTREAVALCALQGWSQNSGDRNGKVRDPIRLQSAVDFVSFLDILNGHEQINSSGGPGVEKSIKKCRLTQHPPTVLDHKILFSILNPLKQVVLKNIPGNKLRARERKDLTPPAIQLAQSLLL